MTIDINDIASKHLGKAGDGTVVKPYITPDHIDPNLLVAVPRYLNREQYGITNDDFTGFDVWNCYEVSALKTNGMPINAVVQLQYPSDSFNIVESKSLKLYLNSFNMEKLGKTCDDAAQRISEVITKDFKERLDIDLGISVHILNGSRYDHVVTPHKSKFNLINLDSHAEQFGQDLEFTKMNEDPSLLKTVDYNGEYKEALHSYSLRSNCRVTNQPDWGDIFIYYKTDGKALDLFSVLEYIVSMRRENHFHEEICECVFKRLQTLFGDKLKSLAVVCLYTRRGGIDINPIRITSDMDIDTVDFVTSCIGDLGANFKTERQ